MRAFWMAVCCVVALVACGPGQPGRGSGSAASAEFGEGLYRDHGCPLCHGPGGAGDGPLAATLVPTPRDLRFAAAYDRGSGAEDLAATLEIGLPREGVLVMQPYPHIPEVDRLSIGLFVASLQGSAAARENGAVAVSSGWVRAAPPGSDTTAAYMTLENRGVSPVELLGAASAAAKAVEIHRISMEGGQMSMAPQDALEIGPGATVQLEPGGAHLMLIGLTGPLVEGETLDLELRLSEGPVLDVELPVRREAPDVGGDAG